MQDKKAVKVKKARKVVEKQQIRRWILKSVAETTPKTAITLHSIKKFLDSKQNGASNNPETKMIIKRLLESGHLRKVDGRYAAGKRKEKKVIHRRSDDKEVVTKVLREKRSDKSRKMST
ncbi:uncharacterized protein CDAR_506291 [Caerostris darwini]|uniref:H15 domain-containing protein n=1 Tax=Caerostris darwini TaxID=1538125 RepID=A0AAV4SBC6_9ARAC|nr:uncharacterized protein CDAR_506291 [Caerostris darwini]